MTPTVAVTVKLFNASGTPCPDGTTVTAKLDRFDTYQGFVIPSVVQALTLAGIAVLHLFPNHPTTGLGATGSIYSIKASPVGMRALNVTAQVPNNDVTLDDIADLDAAPELTSAQAAQASAAAAAGAAGSSATAAATYASNASGSAGASATSAQASMDQAVLATNKAAEASDSASLAAASAGHARTSEQNADVASNAAAISAEQASASVATLKGISLVNALIFGA